MKRIITALCCLVLQAGAYELQAANVTVNISNNVYTPQQVTINVGEMVTWHWVEGVHPTISDSAPAVFVGFTLSASNPNFSHTFNTAGTYSYHCSAHGAPGVGMYGTVQVMAAPTGVKDDQLKKALLNIYPNPAQNKIKVALNVGDPGDYEVRLTNAIGKAIKTVSAAELKAVKETEIDLSAVPAGIYFYTLWRNDEMVETRRLVISK